MTRAGLTPHPQRANVRGRADLKEIFQPPFVGVERRPHLELHRRAKQRKDVVLDLLIS